MHRPLPLKFRQYTPPCCRQFGVNTAHGPLLSSGLISQGAASRAVSARVVHRPQDDSADLVVNLMLAPSYVTYHNK